MFKIAISAYQRFLLVALSHGDGHRITSKNGKRYRRFVEGFGLRAIVDASRKNGGNVPTATATDETPRLITVSIESIEYALSLAKLERSAAQEDVIGPLFDVLELIAAKLPYEAPTDVAELEPELDALRWSSNAPPPNGQHTAELLTLEAPAEA